MRTLIRRCAPPPPARAGEGPDPDLHSTHPPLRFAPSNLPGGRRVSLFDLGGKVAVVTGSSRGIGRAIVERLAEHGAKVVVSSRKVEPCQEVAAAINAKFGDKRAAAIPA